MSTSKTNHTKLREKGSGFQRLPNVTDGTWCSEPGIGGMKAVSEDGNLVIKWVTFVEGVKSDLRSAQWKDLCEKTEFSSQRMEVGLVVSAICKHQAGQFMNLVGHPSEVSPEAKIALETAATWELWASARIETLKSGCE